MHILAISLGQKLENENMNIESYSEIRGISLKSKSCSITHLSWNNYDPFPIK